MLMKESWIPATPEWFLAQTGFLYTLARLEVDDMPTQVRRRDIDSFLSPQDYVNFLRFTQEQVLTCLLESLYLALCCSTTYVPGTL